jgi:putative copper export protein
MPPLYYVSVALHIVAALLWLGGMLFLAVVAAPVLRGVDPELRRRLFDSLGYRFRTVGWICIAVLLATGTANLSYRGFLRLGVLREGAFWDSPFGLALAWKLAMVAVMVVFSALHDFWLGPAAGRHPPGSPAAVRLNRVASWLARLNALAGLVLIIAAARLARGG